MLISTASMNMGLNQNQNLVKYVSFCFVDVDVAGIGAVVDIEGNCRFYDLIRLRKMCKISAKTKSVKGEITWRMFPDPVICTNSEALLGVIQGTDKVEIMREPVEPTGSSATPDMTPANSCEMITESELLSAG